MKAQQVCLRLKHVVPPPACSSVAAKLAAPIFPHTFLHCPRKDGQQDDAAWGGGVEGTAMSARDLTASLLLESRNESPAAHRANDGEPAPDLRPRHGPLSTFGQLASRSRAASAELEPPEEAEDASRLVLPPITSRPGSQQDGRQLPSPQQGVRPGPQQNCRPEHQGVRGKPCDALRPACCVPMPVIAQRQVLQAPAIPLCKPAVWRFALYPLGDGAHSLRAGPQGAPCLAAAEKPLHA